MIKQQGDIVYYKGIFGILKKCTIVKVIKNLKIKWSTCGAFPYYETDYIVRFKNGKEKLVDGKKIL